MITSGNGFHGITLTSAGSLLRICFSAVVLETNVQPSFFRLTSWLR